MNAPLHNRRAADRTAALALSQQADRANLERHVVKPCEWQPIETAPKDGSPILLGHPETEDRAACSGEGWWMLAITDAPDEMGHDAGWVDSCFHHFWPGRSFGSPEHQYAAIAPTHWMPLPLPPEVA